MIFELFLFMLLMRGSSGSFYQLSTARSLAASPKSMNSINGQSRKMPCLDRKTRSVPRNNPLHLYIRSLGNAHIQQWLGTRHPAESHCLYIRESRVFNLARRASAQQLFGAVQPWWLLRPRKWFRY